MCDATTGKQRRQIGASQIHLPGQPGSRRPRGASLKPEDTSTMSNFHLSQVLEEGPSEPQEPGFQSCCDDMEENILRFNDRLELLVSHNPKTLSCIASLLLQVNQMKKSWIHSSRKLSDQELCSAIMEVLVEERAIKLVADLPETSGNPLFQRANSVKLCTLSDDENKDIIYDPAKLQLRAFVLKGGQTEHKVNFQMSRYITASSGDKSQAFVISIVNNKLYFSCSMQNDKPVLNLEECSEADLERVSSRFLFYRKTLCSLTTFESVRCPGWFISTSQWDRQSVDMCEVDVAHRRTSFQMNEQRR